MVRYGNSIRISLLSDAKEIGRMGSSGEIVTLHETHKINATRFYMYCQRLDNHLNIRYFIQYLLHGFESFDLIFQTPTKNGLLTK